MEKRRAWVLVNLSVFFLFLFIILSINFFHVEKTLCSGKCCPACQFQTSTLITNQLDFTFTPQLAFLAVLKIYETFQYHFLLDLDPPSRSPPLI